MSSTTKIIGTRLWPKMTGSIVWKKSMNPLTESMNPLTVGINPSIRSNVARLGL